MKEKVLRIDRPEGRRVLKFDGAFGPEGCGIALSGNEYEVSVTDLPFCIIRYDRHSADWLAALATPFPAAPDFPLCRGQNKTPRIILFISSSKVSTGCCAPACGGKVVAPATKRGAFPRTHNPIAKPPGLSSRGFIIPFPSGGKGQGLYPHITVLHISSHPAWRDEGGVIGEARLFSGLPWPGVRGGILQPVSFPP